MIVDGRIIETLPTTQLTEVRDHPSSERIAWAYDFIGFKGGAGGDVAIIASGSVVDRIRPGQWVMLSRQDYSASLPLAQRGPATHTWYRIVAADAPTIPEITTANFPYRFAGIDPSSPPANTSGMWSRVLTLDGPDWDFNLATPGTYGDDFLQDDTIVTIVDGAVEVIQSQVLIE